MFSSNDNMTAIISWKNFILDKQSKVQNEESKFMHVIHVHPFHLHQFYCKISFCKILKFIKESREIFFTPYKGPMLWGGVIYGCVLIIALRSHRLSSVVVKN